MANNYHYVSKVGVRPSLKTKGEWQVRYKFKDADGKWKDSPSFTVIAKTENEARELGLKRKFEHEGKPIKDVSALTTAQIVERYKLKRKEDVALGVVKIRTVTSENSIYDAFA